MGTPRSAAMLATSAWDPSPPAMPITSAPLSMASRASCSRSSPGCRTMGSMPRVLHSSTRWNFSAFPPPDLRFMISAPRRAAGTGVPGVRLRLRVRRSRESAYLARPVAASSSTMRIRSDRAIMLALGQLEDDDAGEGGRGH